VLALALISKFTDHIELLRVVGITGILKDLYEFLRDMSLLIATGGVAYVSNIFQKRHAFIDNLKEEWRDIIGAKTAVLSYMHKEQPTHEEYVAAFTRLSETIDNMRIVYRNVGETKDLIGLYPFAPLHDMRRVLQTLDPRTAPATAEQRKLARDTMLQSFYALREYFLDELDLEEPDMPLLMAGARRLKRSGATRRARRLQDEQIETMAQTQKSADASDTLLATLYERESLKNGSASSVNGRADGATRLAAGEAGLSDPRR
jgi:hypothetical protein